ncbi:DUF4112 domain-containing protein [Rhizosaccharibacter radicis]|uniref:DUF4112 domain-containing protein n=1 Tax=Rhizosaccharibacter radicis TaxID=2782605 RepID=A0ABT1VZ56_9PROT|nr:DUF4112 domain-containing protein [Acetobacteraceae bacterium KSS12]
MRRSASAAAGSAPIGAGTAYNSSRFEDEADRHGLPRRTARALSRFLDAPVATGSDASRRLKRIRRLAWLLDAALRIPGTRFRFGIGTLIGLPPAAGDAVLALISLYIVWEAHRLGVPKAVIARMLGNVAVEAVAGSVPVLGDVIDATYKANLRNIALLEAHLADPARVAIPGARP